MPKAVDQNFTGQNLQHKKFLLFE
ncbi:hypothetical protein METHP14_60060 [Pseudomonas sp. P14-2025]